jgi:hydrogenase maturation protease
MATLEDVLREGACLVGVGNAWRRDDGVGPWIIEALRGAPAAAGLGLINAESVPENVIHGVARTGVPNVVFVDAAAADGPPGSVLFGPLAEFDELQGVSTHKLALALCAKFLEAAGKRVYLLGIVPADLELGQGLTAEVQKAAASVRDAILGACAPRP